MVKKSDKPKKDWVCTNCIYLTARKAPQTGVVWECERMAAVIRPEWITVCKHRNAGSPFEE